MKTGFQKLLELGFLQEVLDKADCESVIHEPPLQPEVRLAMNVVQQFAGHGTHHTTQLTGEGLGELRSRGRGGRGGEDLVKNVEDKLLLTLSIHTRNI